jgi:hypothetical protein
MVRSIALLIAKAPQVRIRISQAYFFLYPAGHFGFTAVTFFIVLPLRQVIVIFLGAGVLLIGTTRSALCEGDAEAVTEGLGVDVTTGVGKAKLLSVN